MKKQAFGTSARATSASRTTTSDRSSSEQGMPAPDRPYARSRPQRADAVRNREIVLQAAKSCFSETGSETSMEEIAKRAGVGVGTLYRSFGSRSALAEAVFLHMLEELLVAASQTSTRQDPWQRLLGWLRAYSIQLQQKSAMLGVLRPLFELKPTLLNESKTRAEETFNSLLVPAQEAGLVRNDVTASDLLQLMNRLFGTGVVNAARGKLWLALVTAGLRPER